MLGWNVILTSYNKTSSNPIQSRVDDGIFQIKWSTKHQNRPVNWSVVYHKRSHCKINPFLNVETFQFQYIPFSSCLTFLVGLILLSLVSRVLLLTNLSSDWSSCELTVQCALSDVRDPLFPLVELQLKPDLKSVLQIEIEMGFSIFRLVNIKQNKDF